MADAKISALTTASALAGTEVLPIVQSSTTKKVAVNDLTVKNIRSNATTGLLQIAGPAAAATRTMTVPDANFTAARTDAAQTFTGVQTFSSDLVVNGIAVGKGASRVSTNTAVGVSALAANVAGSLNAAFGRTALMLNTGGIENTAIGGNALQSNVGGNSNVGVGTYSLVLNVSGAANTGVGWGSLRSSTASNNTGCGFYAGYDLTTGSNCGFFGYNAQPSAAGVSNEYTYGDANVTKHRFVGGDIVIGTSGKGIDFSITSSGSGTMTSELLADYEEGDWTPTFTRDTPPTFTYGTVVGKYTKIGDTVAVQGTMFFTVTSAGGGLCYIGGLPFATTSTSAYSATGSVSYADCLSGGADSVYVGAGGTGMVITVNGAFPSTGFATGRLYFSITYKV